MQTFIVLAAVLVLSFIGFHLGRRRAVSAVGGKPSRLHSLPSYHGLYVALWCGMGMPSIYGSAAIQHHRMTELDGCLDPLVVELAFRLPVRLKQERQHGGQDDPAK